MKSLEAVAVLVWSVLWSQSPSWQNLASMSIASSVLRHPVVEEEPLSSSQEVDEV
jgi:hypothetical protein